MAGDHRMLARVGPNTVSAFPDPRRARRDGLIGVGGELSVEQLRLAYRRGIFPWTADPITWWSPDPRGIIELDRFHVSRSLAAVLRKGTFTFTIDCAFAPVIKECSLQRLDETWISPEFIQAYSALHQAGSAHSVECWQDGELVGGIYGVSIGRFFAGESMFHRVSNASKAALYHLVEHLRARDFLLFDIQMVTPATRQLGAIEISRGEYLDRLHEAVAGPDQF